MLRPIFTPKIFLPSIILVFLTQGLSAQDARPLTSLPGAGERHGPPGVLPGTERWIAVFKKRSFDLSRFREAVFSHAPSAVVKAIVADLEDKAKEDQAPFAAFVRDLGGRVTESWWIIDGCALEIPFSKIPDVRKYPNLFMLVPDAVMVPLAPIKNSTNIKNHRVDPLQAQGILGKGVSVAILDTGQDSDMNGTGRPHATYYVNGDPNNKTGGGIKGSRLLANRQIGTMPPDDVHGHGTAVAGIAAGEKWKTSGADKGHVPLAGIVGYSIADTKGGGCYTSTVIRAWQRAGADKSQFNIVAANNSYSGSPNPLDPAQQALDSVALNADILPVVACGNYKSYTGRSQSCVNGLAVGAVRYDTKKVASFSSRGPLYGDTQRYYPDLCACGVSVVMPAKDKESSNMVASGTSMASPQVCGAAALYRSLRKTATALETKAAILATTENVAKQNPSAPYNSRNAYGVGFLRDDRLAAVAQGKGFIANAALTTTSKKKTFMMPVQAGKGYSVVVAWNRMNVKSKGWSNLSLKVKMGKFTLGFSDTPRNLYEKVVFSTVQSGTVDLIVEASTMETSPLPISIVACEVPPTNFAGFFTAYGTGCKGTGVVKDITTVLPMDYAGKWGESQAPYIFGYYDHRYQQIFAADQVPLSFTASVIAFRHDDWYSPSLWNYWAELTIDLGTTTVSPDMIGRYFVSNLRGPMTRVLPKTKIKLPYWTSLNKSLSNWLIRIPLSKPFTYVKKSGEYLILDTRKTNSSIGYTNASYYIDTVFDTNTIKVSRVFSTSAGSTFGTVEKGSGAVVGFVPSKNEGAVPILDCPDQPKVGKTITLGLQRVRANAPVGIILGFSDHSWAGLTLPLDLTPIGAKGCRLLAGLNILFLTSVNGDGIGSFKLPIPGETSLILGRIYFQALVLDPGANQAGLSWSNGLKGIIGG